MLTALFKEKDEAERAFSLLKDYGYTPSVVSVLLSRKTYDDWFRLRELEQTPSMIEKFINPEEQSKESELSLEDLLTSNIARVPRIREEVISSESGLIMAGPLVSAVGSIMGLSSVLPPVIGSTPVGILISSVVSRGLVSKYTAGLEKGGVMIGFEPHEPEEIDYFKHRFEKRRGELISYGSPELEIEIEPPIELSGGDSNNIAFYNEQEKEIIALRRMRSFGEESVNQNVSTENHVRKPDVRVYKTPDRSGDSPPPSEKSEQRTATAQETVCYFYAEMEKEVVQHHVATVEVRVSREKLDELFKDTATGEAKIDPDKKLVLEAFAKDCFEVQGDHRMEIDAPQAETPETVYFYLKAIKAGTGRVLVVCFQEQLPLIFLQLEATIKEKPRRTSSKSKPESRLNPKASAHGSAVEIEKLERPIHALRIIEKDESSFIFELDSIPLDISDIYQSRPIKGERRKEFIKSIYREIEQRWLSNKVDVEAFNAELRAYGGELFDQLIPDKLGHILWENRNRLNGIHVTSEEPFIPWELIHIKEPGKPLPIDETLFLGQMGLVRWLYGVGMGPATVKVRSKRARYVIPEYPIKDLILPEAKKEYKFLADTFHATGVTPHQREVRELISRPGNFDLLHFSGHGTADSSKILKASLLLEGRLETKLTPEGNLKEQYLKEFLDATMVKQFGRMKGKDNRPMVVLNACQTGRTGLLLSSMGGFAKAFLTRGAGVFVGTLWSVGDHPARTFTETLYSEMAGNGVCLTDAVVTAREKARRAGDATWLAYTIYGHPLTRLDQKKT